MSKFFRVDGATGYVTGISQMSEEDATANLGVGEVLLPFDSGVNWKLQKWDFVTTSWVARTPPPDPSEDPLFNRTTAYSEIVGDQIGAMMKVINDLLAANPSLKATLPSGTAAEFDGVAAQVDEIKDNFPI